MKNNEKFTPRISMKERWSLEGMAKTNKMTVEEFLENIKFREEYKQKCIKSFMDNGMNREGAELQTMRMMYICG